MEPLPAAVLLRAAGAEDAGRAHPVAAEERLLPQEGRGQTQRRQGELVTSGCAMLQMWFSQPGPKKILSNLGLC